MLIYDNFVKLKELARKDPELKERLLATRDDSNALTAFCRIANESGCEIYPMDIFEYAEVYYTEMKRSTNGGGENSPMLSGGWDNIFELLLSEL